jgi:thiol:disulfide interchange protein DsbA
MIKFIKGSLLAVLLAAVATLHAAEYVEGQHYLRLDPPVAPIEESEATHEVVELFWYGCSHCFDFEPYLQDWHEKGHANVNFVRIPAIFNKRWEQHARAFYALELMGELESAHKLIFEGIHAQGRALRDVDSIARFLAANGIDEEKFRENFNSFAIETKIARAKQLLQQYQVTGVPTMIVDGKFKVTASTAGGYQQAIEVVEKLTAE